jgi:ABC-2 type transport system ATP-binding protein
MSGVIHAEGLSKSYRRVDALRQFDLEVEEGAIYALIGPNGAGKTTFIKLMMHILEPDAGRSELLGVDSRRLSAAEMARIGYVSESQKLPLWMTLDYLLTYLRPFYPGWDDAFARDLARQFDLPPDRKLRNYSRGMRMKAALVASLAYHPRLLILDEPFSGLDPLVREELTEGLLAGAEGATVLISSHDLADVERFASHVGYLERGRLALSEEMEVLQGRFREVEITVGSPASLPEPWPDGWYDARSSAAVVRFVESRFDEQETPHRIGRLFPGARQVEFHPMSLRDIFVVLARAGRKAA